MLQLDQIKNITFVRKALAVTPSDSADLAYPGTLFLDQSSTEGNVKVDLIDGGTVTIAMKKGVYDPIVVKRVYATDTTAVGIFLNPLAP